MTVLDLISHLTPVLVIWIGTFAAAASIAMIRPNSTLELSAAIALYKVTGGSVAIFACIAIAREAILPLH